MKEIEHAADTLSIIADEKRSKKSEANARYYAKHRDTLRERNRAWRQANPDKVKEINHRYYMKSRYGAAAND